MTTEEYESAKKAIIAQHGPAEYDCAAPLNLSARLLTQLKSAKANAGKAVKKAAAEAQAEAPELGSEAVSEAAAREDREPLSSLDGFAKESDLEAFTSQERQIILTYLSNPNQKPKDIAIKLGIAHHRTVAAVLDSKAFQLLFDRLARNSLKPAAFLSIRAAMRRGDPRVSLEVLKDQGIIGDEAGQEAVGRIDDPVAELALKTLGDALAVCDGSCSPPCVVVIELHALHAEVRDKRASLKAAGVGAGVVAGGVAGEGLVGGGVVSHQTDSNNGNSQPTAKEAVA